jgi:hypothetical protein
MLVRTYLVVTVRYRMKTVGKEQGHKPSPHQRDSLKGNKSVVQVVILINRPKAILSRRAHPVHDPPTQKHPWSHPPLWNTTKDQFSPSRHTPRNDPHQSDGNKNDIFKSINSVDVTVKGRRVGYVVPKQEQGTGIPS